MKKTILAVCTLVCVMVMVFATNTNAAVTISSNAIQMNVTDAIVITVEPVGYNLYETETLTLSITAVGSGPITYQWQKDGGDIGGETNSALTTIPSALATDSGSYTCAVTNGLGSVLSAVAVINVYTQPTVVVTVVPPDILGVLDIASGANAIYTVTITPAGTNPAPSAGTVTLQWLKDVAPVTLDAHAVVSTVVLTGDTLTFTGLLNPGDTGLYSCTALCTAP